MSIDYTPQAAPTATPVPLTPEQRQKLLDDWDEAKAAAKRWKEYEQSLRKYIVENGGLFDTSKVKGTETIALDNGDKLKAKKSVTYKVANKNGEAFTILHKLAALGEVSASKAKDLFRFDAELRVSNYNKLDEAEKALVDEIITTKSGMPTLELVEAK